MRLPDRLDFNCPVKVLCGRRALEHIPYELATLNVRKPLLLTDEAASRANLSRALVDALRESDMILGALEALPLEINFDLVHELAAFYRDRDHDALLVMGTGPLTDLAKLVNIVISTGQDDPTVFSGEGRIEQHLKPLALIAPAGATGYEAAGRVPFGRIDLRSIHLMPDLAIVDERTVGAPAPDAIIETALAALTFGAEAMLNSDPNPMMTIYAANAVQMAMAALISAEKLPQDVASRMHAAIAAVMAGCTLADQAPGEIQQLGSFLAQTGRISLPGALGILLPAAVGYALRHRGWAAESLLTALVGLDRSTSTPVSQKSMRVVATLMALMNDLFNHSEGRIPRTLQDAGFSSKEVAPIGDAFVAAAKGVDQKTVQVVLRSAMNGEPV